MPKAYRESSPRNIKIRNTYSTVTMKIQYRSNRNKSCHNPINMDTHVSQVIESKPQKHK